MLLLLLLLVAGSFCTHYELEGHLVDISAEEVSFAPHRRSHFAPAETKVRNQMYILFQDKLHFFFVDQFQIHGEGIKPSAMFTAFMTTPLNRTAVIQKFSEIQKLTVFRLKEIASLPSPSNATDRPQTSCQNGGFLLPNLTCACPKFLSGPNCNIKKCLHQGILDEGQCSCPPGVYGTFCESHGCLPQLQDSVDNSKQSFILVVNQKTSMSYVLNNLVPYLSKIIGDNQSLYSNYLLVNYLQTDTALHMSNSGFYTFTDMLEYLNSLLFTSQGTERQPNNRAILRAQSFYPYMRPLSNVFAFFDSLDSEDGFNNYQLSGDSAPNQLILQTIAWRNRIVFMMSQQKNQPVETSDQGYQVYKDVSRAVLGDFVTYDLQECQQAFSMLGNFNQNENLNVRYNRNNQENENVTLFQSADAGDVMALLTVDTTGKMPNITNEKNDVLPVVSFGSRFTMVKTSTKSTQYFVISAGIGWNLRVFSPSTATILLGYDYNVDTDVGFSYTPAEYPTDISGAVLGVSQISTTLTRIDSSSGTQLSEQVDGEVRSQACSFPITMATINGKCTPGPFGHRATIQISDSEVLTRIVPGYCVSMDVQQPAPFECLNGGTKISHSCICPDTFTGPNCGDPVCSNRGRTNKFTRNGYGLCSCLPGFSGDFCDIVNCTQPGPPLPSKRTSLGIIVQSTMSQAHVGTNISNGVNLLISGMKGKDQFYNLILTTFRTDEFGQTDSDVQIHESISLFEKAVKEIPYQPSSATTQDSLTAMFKTVLNTNYHFTALFVFVDSPQSTQTEETDLIQAMLDRQIQLNLIVTPPFGMNDLCMKNSDTSIYQSIARKTGGIFLNFCNPYPGDYAGDPISQAFSGYALAHHETESVSEQYNFKLISGMGMAMSFYVDEPENDVFLIVNCPNTASFTSNLFISHSSFNVTLKPSTDMPFMAVYKLPLLAAANNEYNVQVSSPTLAAPVFMKVVVKSKEQAYLRFEVSPDQDSTNNYMRYAQAVYPVVHITDSTNFSKSAYVSLVAANEESATSLSYMGNSLLRTNSCSFEYVFPSPLVCNVPMDSFIFNIQTVRTDGKIYKRAFRGFCYLEYNTCANGGLMTDTGRCQCSTNFNGKYCQFPICRNNGFLQTDLTCVCAVGYTGQFCEKVQCNDWNYMESVDPRLSDLNQITFVIDRNIRNLLVNTQLSGILSIFSEIPSLFSLVVFDSKGVQSIISTSDLNQFSDSFANAITTIDKNSTASTKSIDAINEAYKLNIQPPGIVFVFTSNSPADPNPSFIDNFLEQRLDTEVNIFYSPSQEIYPQLPPSSKTNDLLYQTVRQSGGRFLPITQGSVGQIGNLLFSATQINGYVFDEAAQDCSQQKAFSFNLERSYEVLELTITGFDVAVAGKVKVFSGKTEVKLETNNIIFKDNEVLVLVLGKQPPTFQGSWTVMVTTTTGSCGIQARVYSPTRVIPGFTADISNDFAYSLPYTGTGSSRDTYMVFRLSNVGSYFNPTIDGLFVFQTNYSAPYAENNAILQTLSLQERDLGSCAYQFVTEKWTVDTYLQQKLVVHGTDDNENFWMRTFYFTFPAASDRPSTCIHGKHDTYGQCICTAKGKWSGDYCQTPICQNGGTSSFGICICPNGYYGNFCEQLVSTS